MLRLKDRHTFTMRQIEYEDLLKKFKSNNFAILNVEKLL